MENELHLKITNKIKMKLLLKMKNKCKMEKIIKNWKK